VLEFAAKDCIPFQPLWVDHGLLNVAHGFRIEPGKFVGCDEVGAHGGEDVPVEEQGGLAQGALADGAILHAGLQMPGDLVEDQIELFRHEFLMCVAAEFPKR